MLLLAAFVQNERRAAEPILPLGLLAHSGRSTANLARGLVYAGMYGMFFFLSQFLQDVQGYSPLRTGVGFLPIPVSVFLASQLTGRVLVRRLPAKVLMLCGDQSHDAQPGPVRAACMSAPRTARWWSTSCCSGRGPASRW